MIPSSDIRWLKKVSGPAMGVKRMALAVSPSTAAHPDIWCNTAVRPPVITVTREWAKQSSAERRARLLHELAHLKGLEHGIHNGLLYSTYPAKDAYSKALYSAIARNPEMSFLRFRRMFNSEKSAWYKAAGSDMTIEQWGHLTGEQRLALAPMREAYGYMTGIMTKHKPGDVVLRDSASQTFALVHYGKDAVELKYMARKPTVIATGVKSPGGVRILREVLVEAQKRGIGVKLESAPLAIPYWERWGFRHVGPTSTDMAIPKDGVTGAIRAIDTYLAGKRNPTSGSRMYSSISSNPTQWRLPITQTAGRPMTSQEKSAINTAITKLPVGIRKKLREDGTYIETVVDTGITASPRMSHLKGVTPRGWPTHSTWDGVTGAAFPKRIVVVANRTEEGHGSLNLVLHEMIHVLDSTLSDKSGTKFSDSAAWQKFFHDNKLTISTISAYTSTYPEEAFAELYSYYLHSKESRERLLRLLPSVEHIFRGLADTERIVARKLTSGSFTPQMRAAVSTVIRKAWAIERGEHPDPAYARFNPRKNLLPPIEWDTKALQRANEKGNPMKWRCDVCALWNAPRSMKCKRCGAPREVRNVSEMQYSITGPAQAATGTVHRRDNDWRKAAEYRGPMADVWKKMEQYRMEHKLNPTEQAESTNHRIFRVADGKLMFTGNAKDARREMVKLGPGHQLWLTESDVMPKLSSRSSFLGAEAFPIPLLLGSFIRETSSNKLYHVTQMPVVGRPPRIGWEVWGTRVRPTDMREVGAKVRLGISRDGREPPAGYTQVAGNPFLEYAMMGAGFGAGVFVANKVLDRFKKNPTYPIMPIPPKDALPKRNPERQSMRR